MLLHTQFKHVYVCLKKTTESTPEAEVDGSLSSRPAWSTKGVPVWQGLPGETLSLKTEKRDQQNILKSTGNVDGQIIINLPYLCPELKKVIFSLNIARLFKRQNLAVRRL